MHLSGTGRESAADDGTDARPAERRAIDTLLGESPVFGGLEPGVRAAVADALDLRTVAAGELVIRQGDPADGLYLVASGRLQVRYTADDGRTIVLGEEGRGALTGEMALVSESPRSADVVALRDSHLLFLSTAAFEQIVTEHPHALRRITGALIDKLAFTARHGSTSSPARAFVVVPLDESVEVADFARRLVPTFERLVGATRVVDARTAEQELDPAAGDVVRALWFERMESTLDAVLYVADAGPTEWTDACRRRADLVLLVASASAAGGTPAPPPAAERHPGSAATARRELVLLHDPRTVLPSGTRAWLDAHPVARHHHVRTDRDGDYARVARLVTDRAVGLVFGGGGARGVAHIGVLRALDDAGVPVDAVGGTSIGSIIAGAVARGLTPDESERLLRAAVLDGRSPVDLTLPALSLASGNRVTEHIRNGAAGMDLEDAWVSCFCVATNLTRGEVEIGVAGPAWRAIRASFSVPGVFPPVPNEAGEVLVDGGMVDNLPIGTMRDRHAGVRVVAIDVGAVREPLTAPLPETGAVSGWNYLWSQLRGRRYGDLAGLVRILVRLTELGGSPDGDSGDCHVRPGVDGVTLLEFSAFDDLLEIGRRDAEPVIARWLASMPAPAF